MDYTVQQVPTWSAAECHKSVQILPQNVASPDDDDDADDDDSDVRS